MRTSAELGGAGIDSRPHATSIIQLGRRAVAHATHFTPSEAVASDTTTPPVLFAQSFLAPAGASHGALQAFSHHGRHALTVQHPGQVPGKHHHRLPELRGRSIPRLEIGRAATLLAVLDELEIEQVDVVGHSEGAINGSLLALARPERVRSLTLINPSGIGGDKTSNILRYYWATRSMRGADQESPTSGEPDPNSIHGLRHYAKQAVPNLRTLHATNNSHIDRVLGEIQDAGVPVGVVLGSTDGLYPPSRFVDRVYPGLINAYHVIDHPDSGHNPFAQLPHETAAAILDQQSQMLTA